MVDFYVKQNAVIVETPTEMHFFTKRQNINGAYICYHPYKILRKNEMAGWLLNMIRNDEI